MKAFIDTVWGFTVAAGLVSALVLFPAGFMDGTPDAWGVTLVSVIMTIYLVLEMRLSLRRQHKEP